MSSLIQALGLLTLITSVAASSGTGNAWNKVARAVGDEIVLTTVALHQPNLDHAERLLAEISDPQSDKFGNYLDEEAMENLFMPSESSREAVLTWLEGAGVPVHTIGIHKTKATVKFSATVAQLRELLNTDFNIFEHEHTGEVRIMGDDYRIPGDLRPHVESVWTAMDRSRQARKLASSLRKRAPSTSPPTYTRPGNLTSCHYSWTPECIRELYDIPLGTKAAPNNSLGIYGSGDAYNQENLDNFWAKFAPFIPQGKAPKVYEINGAVAPGEEVDGEELLDIQMAWPIAWPQNITIFQVPGFSYSVYQGLADDFLDAVDGSFCTYDGGDNSTLDPSYPAFEGYPGPAMCGVYNITNVVSISYAVDELGTNEHYVRRQCHEWMKMALRGVSVLVASGDRGVSGLFGCQLSPENQTVTAFSPMFPAVCPYVTAVGATQVNFNAKGAATEVAVNDPAHFFWSGGGFSWWMARPKWQDNAVKKYLAAHDPHYIAGTFNASGRGIPDVALLGADVTISDHDEIVVSGGTSASTPLFAGMISRINDERLLAGKKPIGFLNQILYNHPEIFHDITVGSNPGCETQGFNASKGWDPVSGLGSPKFPKLRELLVNLP